MSTRSSEDRRDRPLRLTLIVIGRAGLLVILALSWIVGDLPGYAILSCLAAGILLLGWLHLAVQLLKRRR